MSRVGGKLKSTLQPASAIINKEKGDILLFCLLPYTSYCRLSYSAARKNIFFSGRIFIPKRALQSIYWSESKMREEVEHRYGSIQGYADIQGCHLWAKYKGYTSPTPQDAIEMTNNYFAYGTLMCAEIMRAVAGRHFSCVPGLLRHYQQRTIRGEVYPGLVAGPGEVVERVVYRGLPENIWTRLDAFEGEMYERKIVCVELQYGPSIDAQTYVLRAEFENRLSSRLWDFKEFLQLGRKRFEAHYSGFEVLGEDHH